MTCSVAGQEKDFLTAFVLGFLQHDGAVRRLDAKRLRIAKQSAGINTCASNDSQAQSRSSFSQCVGGNRSRRHATMPASISSVASL